MIDKIIKELSKALRNISAEKQKELASRILNSKKIFIAGVGRSGMMAKCFAMRLMHMGIDAYVVGETITSSFGEGDLLIVTSGSGTTESLVSIAKKAKTLGGEIALITIYPDSIIGEIADCIISIDAPTTKGKDIGNVSIQPMGSLFEQSLLICLDYIVIILMEKINISENEMFSRHANLE